MSAANPFERREESVRRLLEERSVPLPPDLHARAVRRGERLLRRRRTARTLLWLSLLAAVLAFSLWACSARPWVERPSDTTPPVTGL
ncbi:hypothetical protein [Streptomyces sp. SCSIO ZS0520]|uniref:hypothetical protein n=1 Tax=Streptomyces sp. SCSIO ZS0520 TaxID=2892996 RepID=UPI0021DACD8E|nr:hypothetical protein [Streptomyces sp. SCSIO ZS0520]